MMSKSEQKRWSNVAKLTKTRSDHARMETEAERRMQMTLTECETHALGLELAARAADMRAHVVFEE